MNMHSPAGVRVKICGLTRPEDVDAAVAAGATYLGLNFFPKSPRFVTPKQAAQLCSSVPPGVAKVSLTVDASLSELDKIVSAVPLDMLQLHGNEPPEQVRAVRDRFGLPVMKVVGIATQTDLSKLELYCGSADQILVDAKPPKGATLPGGNGVVFDWRLIAGRRWPVPWMLAGGLTPGNVADAVRLTGAQQVDVASGIESAPGVKDKDAMKRFVQMAQPTPA